VQVALGSTASDQQELAEQIARLFRDNSAVESTVHCAILRLGKSPDR
jgi:hypothetical protein